MKSMSRSLVKEIIWDVFATGYCEAIDGIEDYSFSCVESVVIKMIHRGELDETFNQSFKRWSRSDSFIQVLIEKIVIDPGFIAPVTSFLKQRVINEVEIEICREPPVTKRVPSPPDRSPSAFVGTTSDEASEGRRSRRRRHDQKDRRNHNRSVKSRDKYKKNQCSSSSSS